MVCRSKSHREAARLRQLNGQARNKRPREDGTTASVVGQMERPSTTVTHPTVSRFRRYRAMSAREAAASAISLPYLFHFSPSPPAREPSATQPRDAARRGCQFAFLCQVRCPGRRTGLVSRLWCPGCRRRTARRLRLRPSVQEAAAFNGAFNQILRPD
jgi:hypothetical protein